MVSDGSLFPFKEDKGMKKVMTALAKMVAVFGIMAVSSMALYFEYVRKND